MVPFQPGKLLPAPLVLAGGPRRGLNIGVSPFGLLLSAMRGPTCGKQRTDSPRGTTDAVPGVHNCSQGPWECFNYLKSLEKKRIQSSPHYICLYMNTFINYNFVQLCVYNFYYFTKKGLTMACKCLESHNVALTT